MWSFSSPFFKEGIIKWFLLFFVFTLDSGGHSNLLFLNKEISFGIRKLGWPHESPYYLSKKKKINLEQNHLVATKWFCFSHGDHLVATRWF
jgi:hypothetical protein